MVRIASFLCRVPVIKFRKGGITPQTGSVGTSSAAGAQAGSSTPNAPMSAPMSTSSIHDYELPPRYRRKPMSQEEIDHINGGGIV